MAKGDKYILLRTANVEWWDVIYYDYRERPDKRFYVPAKYVRPLDIIFNEGDCDHDGRFSGIKDLSRPLRATFLQKNI